MSDSVFRLFRRQQRSANERGIAWEMTLDEWWRVWQDSGHWSQRGRRSGQYVMARLGDVGPYSVANVYITTSGENVKDYYREHGVAHGAIIRQNNIKRSLRDARGWTYIARSKNRPYQVMYSKRYIGSFATQAEAEAAHRAVLLSEAANG